MDGKEDLYDLKRSFKIGQLFNVSCVQRRMMWCYNRARRTIDLALNIGDAEEVKRDGLHMKYQFIKR